MAAETGQYLRTDWNLSIDVPSSIDPELIREKVCEAINGYRLATEHFGQPAEIDCIDVIKIGGKTVLRICWRRAGHKD